MKLRDYQTTILQKAIDAWKNDGSKNYIINACVASGKSVMLAALAQGLMAANEGFRILMLVPNKELVQQNYDELLSFVGEENVGICSASAGRYDTEQQIIVGTVGTIIKRIYDMKAFNMTNVDECHLVNSEQKGQYRELLEINRQRNHSHICFGWTGTPFRGNGIFLTSGKTPLFHEICASVTIRQMLDDGWLCPLKSVTGKFIEVSSEDMRKTGQDFNLSDIDAAFDDETTQDCVQQMVPAMQGRNSIMVYCSTIAHAERTAAMLAQHTGEGVECVHSKMENDREAAISRFVNHKSRWMVNVAVLTTGFDHPAVDGIVLMRNTSSPVLLIQIAGRGMRRYDQAIGNTKQGHKDKIDCLWLDFTDTTSRMGPVDAVTGREAPEKRKKRKASLKMCPACSDELAASARICDSCGHVFQFQTKYSSIASGAAILSTDADAVDSWSIQKHTSRAGNVGAKVIFKNNTRNVGTVYISTNSPYTTRKMHKLWEKLGGSGKPADYADFIQQSGQLTCPAYVKFDRNSKFPELLEVFYAANDIDEEVAA